MGRNISEPQEKASTGQRLEEGIESTWVRERQ